MTLSPDFYALLFNLFDQIAKDPGALPIIPYQNWPTGLDEQGLLEVIQDALVELQARIQERLSQAEEMGFLYRNIFDSISDGLIINDSVTGIVVETNLAACAIHGYAHEEFIGLPPTAYIHPDSYPLSAEYLVVQPGSVV